MRRRAPLGLTLALSLVAGAPAGAQTLGRVDLFGGGGATWQREATFAPVGPQLWFGAETVLERSLRVRLDAGVQVFGYRGVTAAPCDPGRYCAPPITTDLQLVSITGVIVWRDTTGVRPWYAVAGLGTYSDANGRDANSRLGVSAGGGYIFGGSKAWFIEARLNVPYDSYGYGAFVPVTVGWRFARFKP